MLALALVAAALAPAGPAVPRIRTLPARPGAVVVAPVDQQPAGLAIDLKPDLVVKEMRIEEGVGVHVAIENRGSAPASGLIRLRAEAEGSQGEAHRQFAEFTDLPLGETRWVRVGPFVPKHIVSLNGKPPPPSSIWTGYELTVDYAPFKLAGTIAPKSPDTSPWGGSTEKCPESWGCIKESDENNNRLRVSSTEAKSWGAD